MTRFNWCQLRCLYAAFNLEGLLEPMQEKLSFLRGHVFNGAPCCYRLHPEEVFLFTLCRLAMGMSQVRIVDTYISGDKNHWMFAYPWMLKYLDERYVNIVGRQGLMHFIHNFLHFKHTIEQCVQCNHQCEPVDGMMTIVSGLNFMLWDVFGFIHNILKKILTPFSGPCGDYEGAARKAEYGDAQQAFYPGYVKDNKIKVETICCQMVSQLFLDPCLLDKLTRASVLLAMSNLNEFLVQLQCGWIVNQEDGKVLFYSFVD